MKLEDVEEVFEHIFYRMQVNRRRKESVSQVLFGDTFGPSQIMSTQELQRCLKNKPLAIIDDK